MIKCKSLIRQLMRRFLKPSAMQGKILTDIEYENLQNVLEEDKLEIGNEAQSHLNGVKKELQRPIILEFRQFYIVSVKCLMEKADIHNQILKECTALHPDSRSKPKTLQYIKSLCKKLPVVVSADAVADEWRIYQCEDIPIDWYKEKKDGVLVYKRIDHYWRQVFGLKNSDLSFKFKSLEKVIKGLPVIAHGNADIERGFSENGNTVTKQRTRLSVESISGIRSTVDGLKRYDGKPERVPITAEFITKARTAHSAYVLRVQEEKHKKEAEIQRQEAIEKEKQVENERKNALMKKKTKRASQSLTNCTSKKLNLMKLME